MLAGCWALVSCAPLRRQGGTAAQIARFERDWAKLERPPYSEEGVPVLLVGEDLTAVSPAGVADGPQLAKEFRQITELRLEADPNAPVSDLSKLVELLAARDFGALNSQ